MKDRDVEGAESYGAIADPALRESVRAAICRAHAIDWPLFMAIRQFGSEVVECFGAALPERISQFLYVSAQIAFHLPGAVRPADPSLRPDITEISDVTLARAMESAAVCGLELTDCTFFFDMPLGPPVGAPNSLRCWGARKMPGAGAKYLRSCFDIAMFACTGDGIPGAHVRPWNLPRGFHSAPPPTDNSRDFFEN